MKQPGRDVDCKDFPQSSFQRLCCRIHGVKVLHSRRRWNFQSRILCGSYGTLLACMGNALAFARASESWGAVGLLAPQQIGMVRLLSTA